MVRPPVGARDDVPEPLWLDDDAVADRPADLTAGLVSLGFIRAALRRSARFWCGLAVVGLLVGFGLCLAAPPSHQASTTLLLTVGPEAQPGTAILDDQAIVQSRTVAGLAARKLGLRQSVDSVLGSYTAAVVTDRVLRITVNAPSSNEAVSLANALATEFLTFRADQLQAQQRLEFIALDQQIAQGKQRVKSISEQISQLSAEPVSSAQQARLSALRAARDRANNDLTALEQATSSNKATTQATAASMVGESVVLDAASPLAPHSRIKAFVLYVGAGIFVGLVLGVSIVVVRAIVSDRLYRRDDVARALAAPVELSVPAIRVSRWRPGRRGLAAASGRDLQHIVAYLRDAVPASSRDGATLAVVPVDDPQVAALSVASLAVSCAQQGKHVVVADLCSGAPAAMLLGTRDPGVRTVSVDGAPLVVAVPDPNEIAPVGPLKPSSPRAQPALAGQLADACASADILLTLVALDPSVGGEHLATWAADAVVVMTAGRSSWTKIHAVGEMIRLAGTRLVAAVLVGADKTDESLGVTLTPGRDAVAKEGLRSDAGGSFVAVDRGPGAGPSGDAPESRFISQ